MLSSLLLLLHNCVFSQVTWYFYILVTVNFKASRREAVLSKIQKIHSMSFGYVKLQEAALHRQNNKFCTWTNFFCSALWLWLRGKPELSFSVLSAKKRALSRYSGGKAVWENHHSALTRLLNPVLRPGAQQTTCSRAENRHRTLCCSKSNGTVQLLQAACL